jgi:predicted ester cyclase
VSNDLAILARMTDDALAAFYRRYNACCNANRFEDLAEFVARDVVVDGAECGLDAYADGLRDFLGVPATGRSVGTQEFAFYRVEADRIAEVWGTADDLQLSRQLR